MTSQVNQRSTKMGWFWAAIPVFMLSATAIGVLVVVSIALDDKGFSVEKDYYNKAVNYDTELAQRRYNAVLGWQLSTNVSSGPFNAVVTVQLSDRAAQPLSGALLEADAFALARGQQAEKLKFTERLPGTYEAKLVSRRVGWWELRISALKGTDRFTKVVRTNVVPSPLTEGSMRGRSK
jgi:nitrogen fixation protein FixH